jgi:hypothetical protein
MNEISVLEARIMAIEDIYSIDWVSWDNYANITIKGIKLGWMEYEGDNKAEVLNKAIKDFVLNGDLDDITPPSQVSERK